MARILLVDDDDSVRGMLCKTLTHFGHNVIEARDGREGLRLFGETGPDLVITDIVMPEKEGLGFLMDLRKKDLSVKVIAMSGGGRNSAKDYLHTATLLGAAKVMAKPFSYQELLNAISEVLPT
jgi:DNA-binding response OmpR family regulator